jgi:hypothetical protein
LTEAITAITRLSTALAAAQAEVTRQQRAVERAAVELLNYSIRVGNAEAERDAAQAEAQRLIDYVARRQFAGPDPVDALVAERKTSAALQAALDAVRAALDEGGALVATSVIRAALGSPGETEAL